MKSRLPLLALCLAAAALFAALGVWQVERRSWKLDLIARVDARVAAPATPLPARNAWSQLSRSETEYRHVSAVGIFDHRRETLVRAVTELGPGFWVLTPLRTSDGPLLVNRGFVPTERRAADTRQAANLLARTTITGLLRKSEPGGGFLRRNDPGRDQWFSRDVTAIAAARGLARAAPFFIDADATPNSGGWPRGGLTVIHFRNAHLSYALTWFALAALSLWGAWQVERSR